MATMEIVDQKIIGERSAEAARRWLETLAAGRELDAAGRPASPASMAKRIEHTLLNAGASDEDVARLCEEAAQHSFRGVCCFPRDVAACKKSLEGSGVIVVTVLDFPLAGGTEENASSQCRRVLEAGADEVDMVVNIRALRRDDPATASAGIARVVEAAGGRPVKVILETGLLTHDQIAAGCAASEAAGASFVKTCTGYGPRGASEEDIVIMRAAVGDRLGVKASGGISDAEKAARMVELGADVIGTSKGTRCV